MTLKVLWTSDIHLNFVNKNELDIFFNKASKADVLIISGDIATGETIKKSLMDLRDNLPTTNIYFVLGNHDYYGSSINEVNNIVKKFCDKHSRFIWLSQKPYVLVNDIPIIGHEGWYDCGFGNTGAVVLSDFQYIKDFRLIKNIPTLLIEEIRKLARKAIDHFSSLEDIFLTHDKAILVTHVPPFKEAAWYKGKQTEDAYLPYFSSKIIGEKIFEIMSKYSDKKLLVLCGHTHHEGTAQILPNLKVITAGIDYYFPDIYMELKDV